VYGAALRGCPAQKVHARCGAVVRHGDARIRGIAEIGGVLDRNAIWEWRGDEQVREKGCSTSDPDRRVSLKREDREREGRREGEGRREREGGKGYGGGERGEYLVTQTG
jgi:hypothetical protein